MATHLPPDLKIPASESTVAVRNHLSLSLNTSLFWQPQIKGLESVDVPALCFVISHEQHCQTRHLLFDLAVRKDWTKCSPATVKLINQATRVHVDKDIAEILDSNTEADECPVRSDSIEAVLLSHHHFHHVGDPSTFPPSTDLVVGPGVTSACWPGYPTNSDAMLLDSDIHGRSVREVDFTRGSPGSSCQIGRFPAVDYFGDGSFYLLDAPGHCLGHMCALARVTADREGPSSDSFVLMGGDACHHAGLLRPSEYLPLDTSLSRSLLHSHPKNSTTEPFLVPSRAMFPQYDQAMDTIRKIQDLHAAENVFVVLAHDRSIVEHVPLFPHPINDWMARGLGVRTRWLFCKDFTSA
ncbi:hypothetical protein P170DRAFT_446628 [Aspergillus steynii IBT 23096]|uniref:Metallo-beta-lactamase domain-containing protein n=1 Tax=Aspergillus steynii IBT 23096 TaxID=1392250 RepID=A0A2I2G7F8_9EURO|nr:uncharacterized protein P170DRAFT_446628 [Aspergillus steynii IBT 23096]PLB48816.1 hypothetical protein P170DRAFT_446628 [Aspergillus steynii IBT 23096]